MIPFCNLTFDGSTSDLVAKNLKKATVNLVSGGEPDKLSFTLADPLGRLPALRPGAKAYCEMGYFTPSGEKRSRTHGPFKIDSYGRGDKGENETFEVTGTSIDFRGRAKGRENKTHKEKSVSDILKAEGKEAGFDVIVSPEFDGFIYPDFNRSGQSFFQMVSEFAEVHDAIEKYADGKVLFLSRTGGLNAQGKPISHKLTRNELVECWVDVDFRNSYGGVKTTYRDHDTGKQKAEKAELNKDDPWYEHRKLFPNQKIAKTAAKSKAKQLKRKEKTLQIKTKIGDPNLIEQMDLTISGYNEDADGLWVTKTVDHTYDADGDGYMTSATAEQKE